MNEGIERRPWLVGRDQEVEGYGLGGLREDPDREGIWQRWDKLPNNKEERLAAASGLGRSGWDNLGLGVDLFK